MKKVTKCLLGLCLFVILFLSVQHKAEASENKYSTNVTVETDAASYRCVQGEKFEVTVTIRTEEAYEEGSRKYIGYFAYLNNGWNQIKSWYIPGGVTKYTFALDSSDYADCYSKGWTFFTASVFPIDDFTQGASLYDNEFTVSFLRNDYKLTYYANGGACSASSDTVFYNQPYGNLPVPTREGYDFTGWYTEKDGGTQIKSDTVFLQTSDQTLYAHWQASQYTITLDANGGSCTPSAISGIYGEKYAALGDVSVKPPEGKEFSGWYTSASGGEKITEASTVTIAGNHTLYAQWKEKDSPREKKDFYYTSYSEDKLMLALYEGTDKKVVVPEMIDGKVVYAVLQDAFKGNTNIEEVYLPDTVEVLDSYLFYGCTNLKKVYLGSFKAMLKPSITDMYGMFGYCKKLEYISMSDSADFKLEWKDNRFESFPGREYRNIKYIYIGDSMKNVDIKFFYGEKLEYVEVGSQNPIYKSVNGVVYSADMKELFVCGTAYKNSIHEIPEGVEKIHHIAFEMCENLQKIKVPSTVREIPESSFYNIHPVLVVRENSYADVWAKRHDYSVEYYGNPVSENEKLNINSVAAELSRTNYIYDGTEKKPEVSLKDSMDRYLIKDTDYTVSYQNNVEAGTATVVITGINCYTGTVTLNFTITADYKNPDNGTKLIDKSSKEIYTIVNPGSTVAYAGTNDKKTTSVTIPETVKIDGVTYKVTSIAANAFKNNKKLKKVVISKNVNSIGKNAFYNCKALRTIVIRSKKLTAKTIGKKAFSKAGSSNYKKLTVKVPPSKYTAYKKVLKKRGLSGKAKVKK